MELDEFKDEVLRRFTRDIVDQFFLYIENDDELMHEYLSILGRENGTDETNEYIEKGIKAYFGFNEEGENHSPKSKLLVSFTEYINPAEEGLPSNKPVPPPPPKPA
jgi:hypothetical protein